MGANCIEFLKQRNFNYLLKEMEGEITPKKYSKEIEDQLIKYNPDSELMMYNLQK